MEQLVLPPVLDACCGPRGMWFDKADPRALFIDKRAENHALEGRRRAVIEPDMIADFTALPFPDGAFRMVVFDPPHMKSTRVGRNMALRKKYGVLPVDWRELLRQGFAECFRVLQPGGTLIFKWAETNIRLSEVLTLTEASPLFGHQTSRSCHWCVFMKGSPSPQPAESK